VSELTWLWCQAFRLLFAGNYKPAMAAVQSLNGWTASLSWLDFKAFMAGFEAFHGCISSLHGFFKNIELASLWWLWSGHKYSMLFHSGLPWLCVSMVPARLQ